ncbi:MAG: sialate O-acetylesterase [Ignavibacteriaceae bacterium]
MQTRIFFLIGFLLLTVNTFSQDQNFHIYLCFGQSNMEGQGKIEAQDRIVDSRFQVMEAVNCSNLGRTMGSWYTAVPPLTRCNTGLSPADYFGRTLVDSLPSNIKVGIVNVSVAGCDIKLYDKYNYQSYVETAPSWMKGYINEYGGNPYGRLVDIARLAQQDGVIKGILLHQGETNTGDNTWPSKVKGVYDNLLIDLELEPDSVPLLAGEVVHADQGGICASMNQIIGKLPQTISNSYVISSSGCTDTTDNLHFNSAGYRELGKRYAVKMLSILADTLAVGVSSTEAIFSGYILDQNYPNPFNPATTISFNIPAQSFVSLKVFDAFGREVSVLLSEQLPAGTYTRQWNAAGFSSGVYFYRLQAGSFMETRKLTLLR